MKKPVVLTIIDGLGYSDKIEGNAWKLANTPMLDELLLTYPNARLAASGKAVGLPEGQMGNSEVGHLNIGAGEIVYTGLSLIRKAIDDGTFFENEAIKKSINHAKQTNGTIQIMGLLSPGGVHSLEEHLFSILDLLHNEKVKNVTLHVFADGRDVAPKSIKSSLKKLIDILKRYDFKLGSIMGRLYAMDRDSMFEKTEKAFEAIKGASINHFTDPLEYIDAQYAKGLSDEFIECATSSEKDVNFLSDNDSIVFFNFRPDRARQLAHLFVGSDLYKEKPKNPVWNLQLTTMMGYEGIKKADVAFDSMYVANTIGSTISNAGLKQLRIAETQKYAHVTFFMDGGVDVKLPGADRILVDSLKIDDFSEAPEMSAEKITNELIFVLGNYDLVIMNYANPDMVGHTGSIPSTIKAVEFIDKQIAKLKKEVDKIGGTMFITADHGNAEIMLDENGKVSTKHSSSDVLFISTDKNLRLENGSLTNITPTILDYLEIDVPNSMDHSSLIIK